jgi:dTDP-L-rhamnose 4-epimerase
VTTVGGLADALARALGGPPPVITGEFRVGDVRHVTATSARAAEVLGWQARVDLETGLASLLAEPLDPS